MSAAQNSPPKISLFLMNVKGFYVLKSFLERFQGQYLDAVICAKDPTVNDDYFLAMRNLCRQRKIPFHERKEKFQLKSDYSFVIGWKWLLKESRSRLIVVHDSLLPRYRGFAPLISALINQEKKIGATAAFASDEYDTGDIILQRSVDIQYPIKIRQAIEKLIPLYIDLVETISGQIVAGKPISGKPQDEKKVSYSIWRDEADYFIDWNQRAQDIVRFIDALGEPYRGAALAVDGRTVRILDGELFPDVVIENRTPGKVIFIDQGCPVIICGKGLIRLSHVVDEQTGKSVLPLVKFKLRFRKT